MRFTLNDGDLTAPSAERVSSVIRGDSDATSSSSACSSREASVSSSVATSTMGRVMRPR